MTIREHTKRARRRGHSRWFMRAAVLVAVLWSIGCSEGALDGPMAGDSERGGLPWDGGTAGELDHGAGGGAPSDAESRGPDMASEADSAADDPVALDAGAEDPAPPRPTGIMDPQREPWRADGVVNVEGNRFTIDEQAYFPKTDFLTAVHPGDDWSGWSSLFYFGFDEAKRRTIRDALVQQEYNSIYLYTLNQGDGIITPYGEGGFSADVNALNGDRVDDWRAMVEDLLEHQLKPFIWLAGDDSPAVAAMSNADWQTYVDHMVEAFEEYPVLWVIGLEVDEYWTPAQVEERRAYLAARTRHPVGVHLTINETRNTMTPYQDRFDFVMGQLGSPQSDAEYAQQTRAYALPDVPWIASEFNVFGRGDGPEAQASITDRSRAIGRVIASVGTPPLVAGIGNGIDLAPRPDDPRPDPEGPPEDFADIIWLHTNVSQWPETATLSGVSIRGGQICLDYDMADQWPITHVQGASGAVEIVANPWVFIPHEGRWYAATWEWMRPGQTCKAMTSVAGDHIKQPPFRELDWRPTPGETYWFMVSAPARFGQMTVAERSGLMPLTWPGGQPGMPDPDPAPNPDVGAPSDLGEIRGYVDAVAPDGAGAAVSGWACHSGWAGSIDVHIYADGPAGQGVVLGQARADLASEPAVAAACDSAGVAHRYRYTISPAHRQAHAGQPIFVHGISPVGNGNLVVGQSGVHRVPAP